MSEGLKRALVDIAKIVEMALTAEVKLDAADFYDPEIKGLVAEIERRGYQIHEIQGVSPCIELVMPGGYAHKFTRSRRIDAYRTAFRFVEGDARRQQRGFPAPKGEDIAPKPETALAVEAQPKDDEDYISKLIRAGAKVNFIMASDADIEMGIVVIAPWTAWRTERFTGESWQAAAKVAVEAMERPIT